MIPVRQASIKPPPLPKRPVLTAVPPVVKVAEVDDGSDTTTVDTRLPDVASTAPACRQSDIRALVGGRPIPPRPAAGMRASPPPIFPPVAAELRAEPPTAEPAEVAPCPPPAAPPGGAIEPAPALARVHTIPPPARTAIPVVLVVRTSFFFVAHGATAALRALHEAGRALKALATRGRERMGAAWTRAAERARS